MDYDNFFIGRSTATIAQDLLGRPLIFKNTKDEKLGGYIVEVEAYLGIHDRAAHVYGGRRTLANEGLYGKGGTIYIYAQRQYFFFNIATQEADTPEGILIRAIEPVWGIPTMLINRNGKDGILLTNGPGKMMQALGIHDKNWNLHLLENSPFAIDLSVKNKKQTKKIVASPRIGINQSELEWAKKPLRYYVDGNPYVSKIKKCNDVHNGWQIS